MTATADRLFTYHRTANEKAVVSNKEINTVVLKTLASISEKSRNQGFCLVNVTKLSPTATTPILKGTVVETSNRPSKNKLAVAETDLSITLEDFLAETTKRIIDPSTHIYFRYSGKLSFLAVRCKGGFLASSCFDGTSATSNRGMLLCMDNAYIAANFYMNGDDVLRTSVHQHMLEHYKLPQNFSPSFVSLELQKQLTDMFIQQNKTPR